MTAKIDWIAEVEIDQMMYEMYMEYMSIYIGKINAFMCGQVAY